jgi:hypothetical protein
MLQPRKREGAKNGRWQFGVFAFSRLSSQDAREIVIILTSRRAGVTEVSQGEVSTALKIALRVADLMSHEILVHDIHTCEKINHELAQGKLSETDKRPISLTIIEPGKPLGDPLKFKPETMRAQIKQGAEDARRILDVAV